MADTPNKIETTLELSTAASLKELRKLTDEIKSAIGDAKKFEKALQAAVDITRKNLSSVQKTAAALSLGGRDAAITNAAIRGRGAAFGASEAGQFSQIAKQNLDFQNKLAQAARAQIQLLAQENQAVTEGNLQLKLRTRLREREIALSRELVKSGGEYSESVQAANNKLQLTERMIERVTRNQREAARRQISDAQAAERAEAQSAKMVIAARRGIELADARRNREELEQSRRVLAARKTAATFEEREARKREAEIRKREAEEIAASRRVLAARRAAAAFDERESRRREREAQATFRASPEGIRQQAKRSREIRNEVLFGDDGRELFGIQARLLAHFKVLASGYQSVLFLGTFIKELDDALKQLQAITASTNTEMVKLSQTLIDVSQQTKFSAVEITEAAVTLGQAGFSSREIEEAIKGVTLLATATGSTLQQAVDIATSTITVFNMRAEEMANITNVMTQALNLSKLDMEKLALGIQYAGNVAADANIPFTELVSALGTISNAGVRSGSTLGTGIRQLIVDLQAPSEKLLERIRELGLSTQDIDIGANGLTGVLDNLKKAGFTTADAMETLEVRAVAAFTAMSRGLGDMRELRAELNSAAAAEEANAVQMEGLGAKFSRFSNVAGTVASTLGGPLVDGLKKVLDGVTSFLLVVERAGPVIQVLGTIVGTVLVANFATWLAKLLIGAQNVATFSGAIVAATTSVAGFRAALVAASSALFLSPAGLATLGVLAGLALLTNGFGLLSDKTKDLTKRLDEAKAKFNETKGYVDSLQQSMRSIDGEIDGLIRRSGQLADNQEDLSIAIEEAKTRFGDLGLEIQGAGTKVEDLISALQRLRSSLAEDLTVNLRVEADNLSDVLNLQKEQLNNRYGKAGNQIFLRQAGFPDLTRVIRAGGDIQDTIDQAPEPLRKALGIFAFNIQNLDQINQALVGVLDVTKNPNSGFDAATIGQAEQLRDRLLALRTSIKTVEGTEQQTDRLAGDIKEQDFLASFGPAFAQAFDAVRQFFEQEKVGRLKGVTDADQRDAIATQLRDETLEFLTTQLGPVMGQLTPEQVPLYEKLLQDQVNSFRVAVKTFSDKVVEENIESTAKNLKEEISTLEEEITLLNRKIGNERSRDKATAMGKQAEGLIARRAELELQLLRIEGRKEDPGRVGRRGQTLQENAQLDVAEVRDRVMDVVDKYKIVREQIVPPIPDYNKDYQHVDRQRDVTERGITSRGRYLKSQLDARGLPINTGRISGAQAYLMQQEIDRNRETELLGIRGNELARVAEIEAIIRQAELQKTEQQARLRELQSKFEGASPDDLRQYQRVAKEVEGNIQKLDDQIVAGKDKVTAATQKATEAQDEYLARTQQLKQISFGEGLAASFQMWREESGAAQDVFVQLQEASGSFFSAFRDGTAQSIRDFVKGTATMGEAFRGFADRVVDSLIDIAATTAANGLINFLGGLALNAFNPAGGAFAAGPGWTGGGTSAKAAGGLVTGGTPNRDSVPVMAMPGEVVLRKSAVDSIGREGALKLNALGAGALQRTAAIQPVTMGSGEGSTVNVWMVTQDQMPPLGPQDVVAIINQDILRGGPTKKLIKQVKAGA